MLLADTLDQRQALCTLEIPVLNMGDHLKGKHLRNAGSAQESNVRLECLAQISLTGYRHKEQAVGTRVKPMLCGKNERVWV
jgi:hypothetical protein